MQPINCITDDDKALMRQWCMNYANAEPRSIEDILCYWNNNKKKLFRGFGNKLRVTIPLEQENNYAHKISGWKKVYQPIPVFNEDDILNYKYDPCNHPFVTSLGLWIKEQYIKKNIKFGEASQITDLIKYFQLDLEKTNKSIFIEPANREKPLKIPAGTKIMRAIRKTLEYYNFPRMDLFNKWRDDISVINTFKEEKINLVLSIHPIDYITMSDNRAGWTSCMSWVNDGCFSVGTIEMMNSNMAIVAYLESHTKFDYNDFEIPNKSWRSLVFANKDIIIVGKNYPYASDPLSQTVLMETQKILRSNLNWKYQYQNQLYQDMIHSYSNDYIHHDFNRVPYGTHKIFTYTNKMYHDMLEDHDSNYWCCRNYVKKSKYFNLSGPATCMHCGEPINEVYDRIGGKTKICNKCAKHSCHECHRIENNSDRINYYIKNLDYIVCEDCLMNDYLYNGEDKTIFHRNLKYFYPDARKITRERLKNLEIRGTISICK